MRENPTFIEPASVTETTPVGKVWRSFPENHYYVHKFISLAELHQIQVFWVIPPLSPSFQAKRFRNGSGSGL